MAAKSWLLTQAPPAAVLPFGTPLVAVHAAGPGRGLGLFTTSAVPKHTLLLADPALITLAPTDDLPQLDAQFHALPAAHQARFLALSAAPNPDRDAVLAGKLRERAQYAAATADELARLTAVAAIMQTNAFNVDLGDGQGSRHRALFPTLARVNHSCVPNAHVCFYPPAPASGGAAEPRHGRMLVHTLRPLRANEEVLISYFDILLARPERQERMKKWGFVCHCAVCEEAEDPAASESSSSAASTGVSLEQQRKYLREWFGLQAQAVGSRQTPREQLEAIRQMGATLVANAAVNASLTPAFPNFYDGLAMLQAKTLLFSGKEGEREGIIAALEQSVIWEASITGPNSRPTTQRLEKLAQFASKKVQKSKPAVERDDAGEYRVVWVDG